MDARKRLLKARKRGVREWVEAEAVSLDVLLNKAKLQ